MTTENLNTLETRALQEALRGDAEWKSALRGQISRLKVKSRKYTSAGGFTEFANGSIEKAAIPAEAAGYPPLVRVKHPVLPHGGAFIVWTTDGVITTLEAVADGDGKWPVEWEAEADQFSFG